LRLSVAFNEKRDGHEKVADFLFRAHWYAWPGYF